MKKYELYKIIIISPAPDRVRRAAACRVKPLMAFIETANIKHTPNMIIGR